MKFRSHVYAFGIFLLASSLAIGSPTKPLTTASAGAVAKLSTLFHSRDQDGNGSLSPAEWRTAAPGLRLPPNFSKVDRNRDGAISFSEFARALGRRLPQGTSLPVDRAKRSFAGLDANADGKVTYVELDNSDKLGNFEIQDWFEGMDGDGNGAIDLGEWRLPDYSRYVGLPLESAEALAVLEDRRHRVIRIDGEPLIVTMDYSPFRVNFTVVGNVVTEATGG